MNSASSVAGVEIVLAGSVVGNASVASDGTFSWTTTLADDQPTGQSDVVSLTVRGSGGSSSLTRGGPVCFANSGLREAIRMGSAHRVQSGEALHCLL